MKVFGQLEKAQLENTTSDTASHPKGMITYRTDLNQAKVSNGTTYKLLIDEDSTQTLSNKTYANPSITGAITAAQTTTPANPASGSNKLYFKADGKLYTLDSSGNEEPVGSGSGTGKNYFSSSVSSGLSVSGFTAYSDAAGVLPVDGTGGSGSANLTLTASATSPLSGLSSLVLSKSGSANMQGYGFSYDMTIDPSDKGKMLAFTMNYGVSSGTYSDDNVIVYFYDVTNSLLLEPIPYKIKNHSLISDRYFSEIQVPYNCSTLRFIIHVASNTTNNFDLKIDDLVFGPQSKQYGAVVTDWNTNWTPTGSWTTNTTYKGKWKQVGDHALYKVQIALSGAPTAATLTVNLPSGHTIDTSKLPAASPNSENTTLGFGGVTDAGARKYGISVAYNNTTSVAPQNTEPGTGGNAINATTPFTYGAGDSIDIEFSVPIVGWSSSQQLSSESATRPVKAIYKLTTTQTLNASTDTVLDYDTKIEDSHGLVSGTGTNWKFTSKIQGTYSVKASVMFTSASWLVSERPLFRVFKNGVEYGQLNVHYFQANVTTPLVVNGALDVPLNAGDYITIVVNHNRSGGAITTLNATANSFVSIHMIQGPSQIAASESFSAKYSTTAGQSITNGTQVIVDFGTKEWDDWGSSVTTGASWKFQPEISGKYEITPVISWAAASLTSTSFLSSKLYKNGSFENIIDLYRVVTSGTPGIITIGKSITVRMLSTDYIDIRAEHGESSARSLSTVAGYNYVIIKRVGNY